MHRSMKVATALYKLGDSTSRQLADHTSINIRILRSMLSSLESRYIVTSKLEPVVDSTKKLLVWSITKENLDSYKKHARCDTLDSENVDEKLEYLKNLKMLFNSAMLDSIISDYENLL